MPSGVGIGTLYGDPSFIEVGKWKHVKSPRMALFRSALVKHRKPLNLFIFVYVALRYRMHFTMLIRMHSTIMLVMQGPITAAAVG